MVKETGRGLGSKAVGVPSKDEIGLSKTGYFLSKTESVGAGAISPLFQEAESDLFNTILALESSPIQRQGKSKYLPPP